jgi:hypothetical protein
MKPGDGLGVLDNRSVGDSKRERREEEEAEEGFHFEVSLNEGSELKERAEIQTIVQGARGRC